MRFVLFLSFLFLLFFQSGCQILKPKSRSVDYFKLSYDQAQKDLRSGEINQAEALLKEVYQNGIESAPESSVLSLFELAKIAEEKGQWELAISRLKECESNAKYLPLVLTELEIPSKLAGLYASVGEVKISDSYARQAEKGLATYSAQLRPDLQPSWWAEILHKMGSIPVHSMNEQNWLAFAKRFESGSVHLLRSLEYADPIWSEKSYQNLDLFFKRSIEILEGTSDIQDDNWMFRKDRVREKLDTLLFLIQKLKLYKPSPLKEFKLSSLFFSQLAMTEKNLIQTRSQFVDFAPYSIENLQRKKIKRDDLEVQE